MPKRVLILSASVGTGHIHAAQAVKHALLSSDRDAWVRHEDALDFANPAFRNLYQKGYSDLANKAPELLGWIYDYQDRVWSTETHGVAFERWNSQALIQLATSYRPDVVVCTHPLPADMISWLICKRRLWTQHAIVVTDFDLNTLWLCQHYSCYFVAIEEARQCLTNIGYEGERVIVSGIPVDPVFALKKDKQEMRKKHGLDLDRTSILLSAGGLGMGPVEEIVPALMNLEGGNQIIAVCGRNRELKARLEYLSEQYSKDSATTLKVFGLTSEMDELMSAADLILGKPGGLTSSEALAKGLPFVIVNPIPGQEERNADQMLEAGVAIRCNNPGALVYKISQLLNDGPRLAKMRANALNFAHPDAAQTIAREVLSMSEKSRSCAVHPREHMCEGFRFPIRKHILTHGLFPK